MLAEKESLLLTPSQAVEAICSDFQQYDPQLLLFGEILRLISDGRLYLEREPGRNGAWVNTGPHGNMNWLEGSELVTFMCRTLTETPWEPDPLAAVCSRVFQTRARVSPAIQGHKWGVLIETGMQHYHCRQCGQCCRALDYHNEINVEDIKHWQAINRQDILEWVAVIESADQTIYRAWVQPGTGQLAAQCPFLIQHPSENRWSCSIHSVKPAICRDYPVSRKHALMTGCRGAAK